MSNKRLSQNFLFDPFILSRIVRSAKIGPDDTVLEIGPGPGTLTRFLAESAKKVIAIELDRKLYESLKVELSGSTNVDIHFGDAMRFDLSVIGKFKAVANIPYHITTPIIFKLLEYKDQLRSMTLTVQKEVAERIVANPGGKDFGVLSLTVQYLCKPTYEFTIPAEAFKPVPKVDSACVHFEVLDRPSVAVSDEELLFHVIRTAFMQRRKTLSNCLGSVSEDIKGVLLSVGIDYSRRPETLGIEDFAKITEEIKRRTQEAK